MSNDGVRLTSMTVAPSGHIIVLDDYGRMWQGVKNLSGEIEWRELNRPKPDTR